VLTPLGRVLFTPDSIDSLAQFVAQEHLFLFAHDLLRASEFPLGLNRLLGITTPYISGADHLIALQCTKKHGKGYIIQGSTWKWEAVPNIDMLEKLAYIFARFGFQATTPASLSEKVLRHHLPPTLRISRPSVMVRTAILDNQKGGRIDESLSHTLWQSMYQYDRVKAYPAESQLTPSPYTAPRFCVSPSLEQVMGFITGYWQVTLVAVETPISPLLLDGKVPVHGESFTGWFWTEEIADALEAGYQLVEIACGYGWRELSNWLVPWIDTLLAEFQRASDPYVEAVIKSMMVALPGRFLRKPEKLTLVPLADAHPPLDKILCFRHTSDIDLFISEWAVHPTYDKESTALSYIGSYIVMKQRQELYHRMRDEHRAGNVVIRSYIDMFATARPTRYPELLGTGLGMYKERVYGLTLTESNRFVGMNAETGLLDMCAPGMHDAPSASERLAFYQRYYRACETPVTSFA